MKENSFVLVAVLLAWFTFATAAARGATITYIVDPTQSVLTISGTFEGTAIQQQQQLSQFGVPPPPPSNSLITAYMGSITANRDISADTVQFTGGNITAENSGTYEGPFTAPPPAQYGFLGFDASSLQGGAIDSAVSSAIRNFSFSPTSPVVVSASSFDVSQISASITAGEVDFLFGLEINGTARGDESSTPITGTLAFASNSASLIDASGIEILTLPIDTDLTVAITALPYLDEAPLDVHLSGSIVATALVPEPGSIAIIGGVVTLLARRRRD